MEQKPVRKVVALTPEQWERVEDYRFANRIASEAEAIRRLIEAGLEVGWVGPLPTKRKAKR